jgi:PAS domain S-box-containing protein
MLPSGRGHVFFPVPFSRGGTPTSSVGFAAAAGFCCYNLLRRLFRALAAIPSGAALSVRERVVSGPITPAINVLPCNEFGVSISDRPREPSDSETELGVILEGIGEGFYAVDRDWRVRRFNSEAARHFGRAPAEVLGRDLWELFPGARETGLGRLFLQAMAGRKAVRSETASVVVPGRWLSYGLFPLGDGLGVVFRDITDHKKAEEQRDLLLAELEHRVKNTLADVQAIAGQTFRDVEPQARHAFEARLRALGNAQLALTAENWRGVRLRALIRSTLDPVVEQRHYAASGPNLRVQPKSAVALSMAIHELCTNAIKYGALSVVGGSLTIDWTIEAGRFRLSWQEQGGPPVSAPQRKGFGSLMIERALAVQVDGDVTIEYAPNGLSCRIDAPLAAIAESEDG